MVDQVVVVMRGTKLIDGDSEEEEELAVGVVDGGGDGLRRAKQIAIEGWEIGAVDGEVGEGRRDASHKVTSMGWPALNLQLAVEAFLRVDV